MTTGIYKLTFPSGNFYIGKSIDIEKRWKQHLDKFTKGTHTKNMQLEYNMYREYTQEVLFACHVDHIDIMEESYIARMCPSLNGTKPKDRLHVADEHLDIVLSYLNLSTLEHIEGLHNGKNKIAELIEVISGKEEAIRGFNEDITYLKEVRRDEELAADITNRIISLQERNISLVASNRLYDAECTALNKECQELWKYKQLPWYKKLFN